MVGIDNAIRTIKSGYCGFIELGQQRVEGVILEYHYIFVGGLALRINDRWDQQVGVAHLTAREFLSRLAKR